MNQFFGEIERKKEEREKARHHTSLAIGAFAALATLTIVIITQKLYNYNIIIVLLFLMLLILISGFYGNSIYQIIKDYLEKRKYDKFAEFHFKNFKNLVIRFKEFTEGRDDNIQLVMHSIKNLTYPYGEGLPTNPFSQINVIQPIFFQDRYNYYTELLNQFKGTKDSLVALAKEFESILYMYDTLYIKDPVNAIMSIGQDKAPKQYKDSYNKARLKYIDFLNAYKNFAKIANEDLKEKEETLGLGGGILFRDYFDFPEEF